MKSFVRKSAFIVPLIVCSLAGLSSCTKERRAFSFVATTDSERDAAVTIGDWQYKFRGNLLDNHEVLFKATTVDRKTAGGPGGPGGFPFFIDNATQKNSLGKEGGPGPGGFPGVPGGGQGGQEELEPPSEEELRAQDFEIKGTWEHEKGYGYILTLADEDNTVIHADFNKTQGRHEFYYNVKNKAGAVETVFFQAKDPTYKDRLADDYEILDKRNSIYIFKAKVSGNNCSLSYAYLYLHKDGKVVENTPKDRSAGRTVILGKTRSEENGIIKVIDNNKTYTSKKCVDSSIDATMIALPNYTYLVSNTKEFKWTKLTPEHFDVKATYKFKGERSEMMGGKVDVKLFLNPNGICKYYEGYSFLPKKEGKWSESDKALTITLGDDAPISSTLLENGQRRIILKTENKFPWGGSTIVEAELNEYKL